MSVPNRSLCCRVQLPSRISRVSCRHFNVPCPSLSSWWPCVPFLQLLLVSGTFVRPTHKTKLRPFLTPSLMSPPTTHTAQRQTQSASLHLPLPPGPPSPTACLVLPTLPSTCSWSTAVRGKEAWPPFIQSPPDSPSLKKCPGACCHLLGLPSTAHCPIPPQGQAHTPPLPPVPPSIPSSSPRGTASLLQQPPTPSQA